MEKFNLKLKMMANLTSANGKKPKKCKHNNTVLRVIAYHFTLEKTAVFCVDCGKQLTETKTE